jgi:AmmeMemoRadiSam system protein A
MAHLGAEARSKLLHIARRSIQDGLRGRSPEPETPDEPALLEAAGAFVTLHSGGALRGCIGNFQTSTPLYRTVAEMSRSAAFQDPRFPPLQPEELERVDIEISALTPLRRIKDPAEVEVGRHGLYIVKGFHRGVLLPQVATQYGWDRIRFLEETCRKAGLLPGAWRGGATIYVFEAEIFGEKD